MEIVLKLVIIVQKTAKKMLKRFGKGLVDYLSGVYTAKDLTNYESFAREFYPKAVEMDNGATLLLLQTHIANNKNKRKIYCGVQSLITATYPLAAMAYFNGEFNPKELAFTIGAISVIKGVLYFSGRKEVKEGRKLEERFKEVFLEVDDEGEEWKNGTDYPTSEDL